VEAAGGGRQPDRRELMRVLLWHVHGSWTTAFVQGRHEYFVPVLPGRPDDGLGRASSWEWPASVVEVTPAQARHLDVDVLVLQRPSELAVLAARWLGRVPGRDVPVIYLEHNTPDAPVAAMRHHTADRRDLLLVHVTHFNALFWDSGSTPRRVIEHGIVDPGWRYTGELTKAAVVVNEPLRRGRVVGTDLYATFREAADLDLFGMGTEELGGASLSQAELHAELPRRRVYLHPFRWTSLGLSLIEAMHLGMPIVALATTEVGEAVPAAAGVVSNRIATLQAALRDFLADPSAAEAAGRAARAVALERYGLERFLADWDDALNDARAGASG
jgi:hypothetical protein